MSTLKRFYYKGLIVNLSVYGVTISLKEMSALYGVHFIEIPLYFQIHFFAKTELSFILDSKM